MARQNIIDLSAIKNADGYTLAGGTTERAFTLTGADVTLTGSGTAVITFPSSTSTLATLALTETLSNKTLATPIITGVTSLLETTAPSLLSGYGKLWASSVDSRLHFMDDAGIDYTISERNKNTYYIEVKSSVYYAENPSTGYYTSNASFDTLFAAVMTQIGSAAAMVEFGVGTFAIADGLSTFKSNIHYKGQGAGLTVFEGQLAGGLDTDPIFEFTSSQAGAEHVLTADADFGDLTITVSTANSAAYAAGDYILLYSAKNIDSENSSRVQGEMHRVLSVDTGTGVITIGEANRGTHVMDDTLIADTGKILRFTAFAQNVVFEGITFKDLATSRASIGLGQVYISNVDNLLIVDCEFKNLFRTMLDIRQSLNVRVVTNDFDDAKVTSGIHYGVAIAGASNGVVIANNTFYSHRHAITGGAGGSLYLMGRPRNISITGNTIVGPASAGIDMHQGAVGLSIVGNTIQGDDTFGGGISVRSPATISGNNIMGVRGAGISLNAQAHGSTVAGNNIWRSNTGIHVERQVNKLTIVGNTIQQTDGVGIVLTRTTDTFTVTVASPAVFTNTGHSLVEGTQVSFSTSGALPTGLTAGTIYYVIAAGLGADTYQVSATYKGAAVNTSGTQSGTHNELTSGGNDSLIADNHIFDGTGVGMTSDGQRNVKLSNNYFENNTIPLVMSDTDSKTTGWMITGNYSSRHTSSDTPTIVGTSHYFNGNVGFGTYDGSFPNTSDGAALGSVTLQWSDLFLAEGGIINWDNGDLTMTQIGNSLIVGGLTDFRASTDNAAALGTTAANWADLFLGSGAVINFNAGDVTITHAADTLTFAGAASGIQFGSAILPSANDGVALGSATLQFSDLFLAEGGVINWDNGDATLTQAGNVLTLAGADFVADNITINTALLPDANDGAALGSTTLQFSDLFLAEGGVINWDNSDLTLTQVGNSLIVGGLTGFRASSDNSVQLGVATVAWADLFLGDGAVINFNNGAVNITHSTGFLTVTGGAIVNSLPMRLKGYTVAGLPAGTQGDVAFVTDALTPTFLTAAVGGGAVVSPVFYNGTAWVTV